MQQEIRQEIQAQIAVLRRAVKKQPEPGLGPVTDGRRFILALGGPAAYRPLPGLKQHMGFESLLRCRTREQKEKLRGHLYRLFDITDRKSLFDILDHFFCAGDEYEQFRHFWSGAAVVEMDSMDGETRRLFRACRAYAKQFEEFVEDRGFYAWDFNEKIGLLRAACACDLISEREFWTEGVAIARQAGQRYDSWTSYGISCLCGAAYFMFRESNQSEAETRKFFQLNTQILNRLFFEGGVWATDWPAA